MEGSERRGLGRPGQKTRGGSGRRAGHRDGAMARVERGMSVVEVWRPGLAEAEVGLGIGLCGIEGGGLVEQEVTLRGRAGGIEGRGSVGEIKMQEDGRNDGRVGEKGEDGHLAATSGAEQRQDRVDAREEQGPANPRGGWRVERVRDRAERLVVLRVWCVRVGMAPPEACRWR